MISDISFIYDLFYRCQFDLALTVLESKRSQSEASCSTNLMIHANIVGETHGARRAVFPQLPGTAEYDYANYLQSRMLYQEEEISEAIAGFNKLLANSKSPRIKFLAQLGLANAYLDPSSKTKVEFHLNEIDMTIEHATDSDRLSAILLSANYQLRLSNAPEKAKVLLDFVLCQSLVKGWTYFLTRAIYGLIDAAIQLRDIDGARQLYNLLLIYCKTLELGELRKLAVQKFGSIRAENLPISFDEVRKCIWTGSRWVDFDSAPLLFIFLKSLIQSPQGVKLSQLAQFLWPDDPFRKYTQEAKIYDIAKRTRKKLSRLGLDNVIIRNRAGIYSIRMR